MKKFKKITAAIAATLMAASMAAPMAMNFAFAADSVTEFNLTIPANSNVDELTAVTAYKIFSIKTEESGGYSTEDADWACDDVISGTIKTFIGNTEATPSDALTAISASNFDAEALARAVAAAIETAGTKPTGIAVTEITDGKYKFDDGSAPANGYYIVLATGKRTNTTEPVSEVTESLGMLTVINGTVDKIGKDGKVKIGLPKVEKKVLEDDNMANDAATYESNKKWNDVADLQIGQEAKFRLYGTLPSNYDEYDTYKYVFHDTLGKEFAKVTNDEEFTVTAYKSAADVTDKEKGFNVKDNAIVTITQATATTDQEIEINFSNLKSVAINKTILATEEGGEKTTETFKFDKNSVIVVEYKTSLTSKAVVADAGGQINEVYLEYSNNPNQSGSGNTDNTGRTPDDKVIVYTYDLEVDKTFFAGSDLTKKEIIDGAYDDFKFTLKKGESTVKVRATDAEVDGDDVAAAYDYIIDESSNNTEMTLNVYDRDGNRVNDAVTEKTYNPSMKLKIKIKGADSDEYVIHEDQTDRNKKTGVQKYNDIIDQNAKIESIIEYLQDWAGSETDSLNWSVGSNKTDHDVDITNISGVTLPSTGGIGTTLFYLGGGSLVALAGVFLITKKRMGKDEA